MTRRSLIRCEIALMLLATFGASAAKAALRLADKLTRAPLDEQQTVLNAPAADAAWLDTSLQLVGALALAAWGGLAVYLLAIDGTRLRRPSTLDGMRGAGLAAAIGLPGLALYWVALHLGLTTRVVPTTGVNVLALLAWSAANALAEELVVVAWLTTRLRQLGWRWRWVLAASSLLRGAYHLYQGVSAGFGNVVMGLVFGGYFAKTRRVWPLAVAHFLIDAVAFVGYALLADHLQALGL